MRANVRVTSVGFLLAHALAPALGDCVEFVADDRSLSFERREADIAVPAPNAKRKGGFKLDRSDPASMTTS